MKNWVLIQPLIGVLFSRKFLVLVVSALAASGAAFAADLEQWIPVIVMFGGALFSFLTAWEDASAKKSGVDYSLPQPEYLPAGEVQEPGLEVLSE